MEDSQGYKLVFKDEDNNVILEDTVADIEVYELPIDIEISGIFTVEIQAIGYGEGKVFNSTISSKTSGQEVPGEVVSFGYDDTTNLLTWKAPSGMLDTDKFLLTYTVLQKDTELVSENNYQIVTNTYNHKKEISYQQVEFYNSSTEEYFYLINGVGIYSNIQISVVRPDTISSKPQVEDDVDLELFAGGNGEENNPFAIENAEQLLNISKFATLNKHFVLIANIDMSGVDVNERLNNFGAIIANEFKGSLNGTFKTIHGYKFSELDSPDTIKLTEVNNFALFNKLTSANIRNLNLGKAGTTTNIVNTFANPINDVVQLSMLAVEAKNSTIERINVRPMSITLVKGGSSSTVNLKKGFKISALVGTVSGGSIKNCVVESLTTNTNGIFFPNNSEIKTYISAVAAAATGVEISGIKVGVNAPYSAGAKLNVSVSYSNMPTITYVGTVAGYSENCTLNDVYADLVLNNAQVQYAGGVIGCANNSTIESSSSSGTINYSCKANTNIGGVVGYMQDSTIISSNSNTVFNITKDNAYNIYVGGIVGTINGGSKKSIINSCTFTQTGINTYGYASGMYQII